MTSKQEYGIGSVIIVSAAFIIVFSAVVFMPGLVPFDFVDDKDISSTGVTQVTTTIDGSETTVSYEGTGTEEDPFQVGTLAQLQAINENLTAHYILVDDIDATETARWNTQTEVTIKNAFTHEQNPNFQRTRVRIREVVSAEDEDGTDVTASLTVVKQGRVIEAEEGTELTSVTITARRYESKSLGFYPIAPDTNNSLFGHNGANFTGSFDGQGHTIDGLTINREFSDGVGVFGAVESGGTVTQITVKNTSIEAKERVGSLVGRNNGTVSNASATGSVSGDKVGVSGSTVSTIGGLVGLNEGEVSNSTAAVTMSGDMSVGGLVGNNHEGVVSRSTASGTVTGEHFAGGLVGYNEGGTVSNSTASGDVTGYNRVGGLVGHSGPGTITESSATGSVSGDNRVGGLVGHFGPGPTTESSATGSVITESSATGSVNGDDKVGGLVGGSYGGMVLTSTSSGTVDGSDKVGGLVGDNGISGFEDAGKVKNSFSVADVTGGVEVGGLVGYNGGGSVLSSASSGEVTGYDEVGGLVGYNCRDCLSRREFGAGQGIVTNSFSSADVTGGDKVGGLVGYNYDGDISASVASGTAVELERPNYVRPVNTSFGGLTGDGSGTVVESYWIETDNTDRLSKIRQNQSKTVETNADGAFTLSQARGDSASKETVMGDDLDFQNTWETVENEFPVLQALDKQQQLDAR